MVRRARPQLVPGSMDHSEGLKYRPRRRRSRPERDED